MRNASPFGGSQEFLPSQNPVTLDRNGVDLFKKFIFESHNAQDLNLNRAISHSNDDF
jgi:hypothetical protein